MLLLWLIYLEVPVFSQATNTSLDVLSQYTPAACRTERRMYLLYDQYKLDTCARCYIYLPNNFFRIKFRYTNWSGFLKHPDTNVSFEANPINTSKEILDSFEQESFIDKWKACCLQAVFCCERMLEMPPLKIDTPYCPRTWDGWQCWNDTPAGTTAKEPCQSHVFFELDPPACTRYAEKICWANGTWYMNGGLREFTHYTNCGQRHTMMHYLYFYITTFSITIVSMIPALIIFSIYKQLQVHRITMHKNLFLSLFLHGLAVVLFQTIVVLDTFNRNLPEDKSILQQNGAGCKFLYMLTRYFRSTNYMWMLCEGYYLHKLIAAAFAEQKSLIIFYFIGWALPVIPVGIYAIVRTTYMDEECWAMPARPYDWITDAPNFLSLLLNLFFLCNIIRVLITKLRATHSKEPSQYRKAVRATLVLVPLFGLQFCLVIYKPHPSNCLILKVYTYFNYAIDGLQGFMVSLIFCYMNGEVIYLVRRSYQRFRLSHPLGLRFQNSVVLNPVSVTQVSTMMESHGNHQGLHCRTKDRHCQAISNATDATNFQENSTSV